MDNEILAVLEELAKGDMDEFSKNAVAVDECSNIASKEPIIKFVHSILFIGQAGMDECDRAAQAIACTKEKSAQITEAVVYAMEANLPPTVKRNTS
jgi:hypothetical protein